MAPEGMPFHQYSARRGFAAPVNGFGCPNAANPRICHVDYAPRHGQKYP